MPRVPDVVLREVTEDDLPIFYAHQADPAAVEMAAFPSRDRDAFMLHWWNNVLGDPKTDAFTIVVDGDVAGHVVSFDDGADTTRRYVGYWIGREHWGRGVATRALAELLRRVTRRPLHAHAAARNVGSIRVLEKCGFVRLGTGVEPSPDAIGEILLRLDA